MLVSEYIFLFLKMLVLATFFPTSESTADSLDVFAVRTKGSCLWNFLLMILIIHFTFDDRVA